MLRSSPFGLRGSRSVYLTLYNSQQTTALQGQKHYTRRSSTIPARAGFRNLSFRRIMSNIADNSLESGAKSGSSSAITPTISQGSSPKAVLSDLENLVTTGWSLDELAVGIEKSFLFKSWTKCLDFVAVVGTECKVKNHHPTIILTYGTVKIHWTTHRPHGLSERDTQMAEYCDEQADKLSTIQKKT